ncbi:unnamed protein product, partial [Adineta ricciae]
MNSSNIDSMRKVYDRVWHWIVKQTYETAESPAITVNHQTKPNEADDYTRIRSYENIKALQLAKNPIIDMSELERSHIYRESPPSSKVKSIMHTKDAVSTRQQQRPSIPVRTDSSRSVASTTLSSMSSRSTTPSNSFRQDPRPALSSSSSTAAGAVTAQMKNEIYDVETAILYNQHKCLNTIANNYSKPLQSVKEDEYLEVDDNNNHMNSNYPK